LVTLKLKFRNQRKEQQARKVLLAKLALLG
jgi:hypothetical protein